MALPGESEYSKWPKTGADNRKYLRVPVSESTSMKDKWSVVRRAFDPSVTTNSWFVTTLGGFLSSTIQQIIHIEQ